MVNRPAPRPERDIKPAPSRGAFLSSSRGRPLRMVVSAQLSHALLDLALIGTGQTVVLALIHERLGIQNPLEAAAVVGVSLLVTMTFLYATGCYRRDALLHRSIALSRVPTALALSGLVLLVGLHNGFPLAFPAARVFLSVSRCVTIILVALSISLCAAMVSRAINFVLLNMNAFRRRILVVGNGARARYAERLGYQQGGLQEMHFLSDYEPEVAKTADTAQRIQVGDLAERLRVDEVVVALEDSQSPALEDLLSCKAKGIPVTPFNGFVERQTGRLELDWLEISWLVSTPGFQFRLIDDFLKRSIDILFSLMTLIISLPVLTLAMIAVALDSPGPVIYRQQRVTQGGRVFWLYKLRTMRVDAEQNGPKWADQNDTRITKVGSFLRRTRLDEIPQLFNILKGDMSMVGPRPERPVFVDTLQKQLPLYYMRHTVRAGLTGWAQVNYPYGASFEDSRRKLEYDLYYIKNFSLIRDIGIILQTVRVVLWPDGVR
jgi:sugar transferase (PEP-CTERM system associated)